MADNAQLIAQCEARAKEWLSPAFDEETRKEVQAMLDNAEKNGFLPPLMRRHVRKYRQCSTMLIKQH